LAATYDPRTGLPVQGQRPGAQRGAFLPGTGGAPFPGLPATGGAGAAPPGAPGAVGGGQQPFDIGALLGQYTDLINNDPILGQLRQSTAADAASDLATSQANIRSALINFGDVPSGLTDFSTGAVDDNTRNLASQNTTAGLSLLARLTKQAADAKRTGINQLAARGALRSGESGHFLQEHQLSTTQARTDATQTLLQYLAGVQAAYAENERRRAEALANARPQYPAINYYGNQGGNLAFEGTRGTYGPGWASPGARGQGR
jgi:hypothetical protein